MASLLERSFACSIMWAPNITAAATTDSRDHDRRGIPASQAATSVASLATAAARSVCGAGEQPPNVAFGSNPVLRRYRLNVRIPPGSGSRADIGGRLKCAITGCEEMHSNIKPPASSSAAGQGRWTGPHRPAARRSRPSRAARSRCSTTCTSSADGSDEQMFGAD